MRRDVRSQAQRAASAMSEKILPLFASTNPSPCGSKTTGRSDVSSSASRSTDIPSFYDRWFFDRLSKGYCVWYNPFNRKKVYVSFRNTRVIVFWTKNPGPIMPFLTKLDEMGIHYYFLVTLNDYEKEGLEPGVPS